MSAVFNSASRWFSPFPSARVRTKKRGRIGRNSFPQHVAGRPPAGHFLARQGGSWVGSPGGRNEDASALCCMCEELRSRIVGILHGFAEVSNAYESASPRTELL